MLQDSVRNLTLISPDQLLEIILSLQVLFFKILSLWICNIELCNTQIQTMKDPVQPCQLLGNIIIVTRVSACNTQIQTMLQDPVRH